MVVVDYTKIPSVLEQRFEQFDDNNALRPTIIKLDSSWEKTFQKSLLTSPENTTLHASVILLLSSSSSFDCFVVLMIGFVGATNGEE